MGSSTVLTRIEGHVGVIQLNRPDALNALSFEMLEALAAALAELDTDDGVHVILLHGSDKAFAAGADIKTMADADPVRWYVEDRLGVWERLAKARKPVIAAVSGYALGGGCELAMMCDIVIAAESAQFGQPEIKLGIIPGAGGTQRLTRAVGKALAMDMVLTGRSLSAKEALAAGLVSRVAPDASWLEDAKLVAQELAEKRSPVALRVAKEAVLKAQESFLSQSLRDERDLFYLLCATQDANEGMKAFVEKRPPKFAGR
jgi:enoyl-CoA hydratase